MARIAIDLPEQFLFSTDLPVRISDINYGGHLGHDALVSLTHEARVRFLRAHGFTELDIEGFGLVMVDLLVLYKAEAFYGDIMTCEVAVRDFTSYGCDIVYRIASKERNTEIARAKTGVVIYDYNTRKVVEVPERFKRAVSASP
jgi:acyl-CoA thioester hydrolase